jgi:hypothetical protein
MCAEAARSDSLPPPSRRGTVLDIPGGPISVEDVTIKDLGQCRFPSPAAAHLGEGAMHFVGEADKVLVDDRLSRLPSSPELLSQLPAIASSSKAAARAPVSSPAAACARA